MEQNQPTLFADGFKFAEAPKWRDGKLWISDVFDHKVIALSAQGEQVDSIDVENRPSGLGFLSDGSLIIVSAKDRKLLLYDGNALSDYADLSRQTEWWLNDFAVGQDRIYVGNFGYDFVANAPRSTTSLHRVDPDKTVTEVANGLDFPNGSVVINGGRTLVVAETWEARLSAFDIDRQGKLSNQRIFADLGNRQPDGICADAQGAIWAGIYNTGEFVRVHDGGEITDSIRFEGSCISCALGGDSRRRLFMTAFIGSEEDMAGGERKSAVFFADVDIPGYI